MCFYFSITKKGAEQLKEKKIVNDNQLSIFSNSYIVSAFTHPQMPVFTELSPSGLSKMHWGLIPSHTKNKSDALSIRTKTLNARAESLFDKYSFKDSILNKRCVLPANGFYEWKKVGKLNYPHYITLANNAIFALAGIWSEWTNPENNKKVNTFSVITCEANELLADIHNTKQRMPLMLKLDDAHKWLKKDMEKTAIKQLLHPIESTAIKAVAVRRFTTSNLEQINKPDIQQAYFYPELHQKTFF